MKGPDCKVLVLFSFVILWPTVAAAGKSVSTAPLPLPADPASTCTAAALRKGTHCKNRYDSFVQQTGVGSCTPASSKLSAVALLLPSSRLP